MRINNALFSLLSIRAIAVIFILICVSCNTEGESATDVTDTPVEAKIAFDQDKWQQKDGEKYPFREQMLEDVVYNDTIRSLSGTEILHLLGNPDRSNEGHLYYTITQRRLGPWPLHTTTMVIKLKQDSTVEWIKISE